MQRALAAHARSPRADLAIGQVLGQARGAGLGRQIARRGVAADRPAEEAVQPGQRRRLAHRLDTARRRPRPGSSPRPAASPPAGRSRASCRARARRSGAAAGGGTVALLHRAPEGREDPVEAALPGLDLPGLVQQMAGMADGLEPARLAAPPSRRCRAPWTPGRRAATSAPRLRRSRRPAARSTWQAPGPRRRISRLPMPLQLRGESRHAQGPAAISVPPPAPRSRGRG